GANLLGHLTFTVPGGVDQGDYFTVRFPIADGSPDTSTQYDFETIRGAVNIKSERPVEVLSDEWKLHFFGDVESVEAGVGADADADGSDNLAEYLAGTDPTRSASVLRLDVAREPSGPVLRWEGARGRSYTLECASDVTNPDWRVIAEGLAGADGPLEFADTEATDNSRFYRVRVQP
ncbi:MAG: hypothetical protein MI757_13250, partial [Pirellulales bacterium]|nr:hypothetical protein [Pirellulales bacterium]